ncbi:hypothetical protein D3C78_1927140 [compost metagenome]
MLAVLSSDTFRLLFGCSITCSAGSGLFNSYTRRRCDSSIARLNLINSRGNWYHWLFSNDRNHSRV